MLTINNALANEELDQKILSVLLWVDYNFSFNYFVLIFIIAFNFFTFYIIDLLFFFSKFY